MLELLKKGTLDDVLRPIGSRARPGVFFLRLTGADDMAALKNIYRLAAKDGALIEGGIGKPDQRQINEYIARVGQGYDTSLSFILDALGRWIPETSEGTQKDAARLIQQSLIELKANGSSDTMVRGWFIKLLCWLRFRFLNLLKSLNGAEVPKLLFASHDLQAHELLALRIINAMGADVVLLLPAGDAAYGKLDPESRYSCLLTGRPFPPGFTLKTLYEPERQTMSGSAEKNLKPAAHFAGGSVPPRQAAAPSPRPSAPGQGGLDLDAQFPLPARKLNVNAWMKKPALEEALTPVPMRSREKEYICTAFMRFYGAWNRSTYESDLYRFYKTAQQSGRKLLLIDGEISRPTVEEISRIRRRTYKSPQELIIDLAGNLPYHPQPLVQSYIRRAFMLAMQEEAKRETNLNKLTVAGVYLLCLIRRYQEGLLSGWKETELPLLVKYRGCRDNTECLYLTFASFLPVDTVIIEPDLSEPCLLQSERLLEVPGRESLRIARFPAAGGESFIHTVASHAREQFSRMMGGEAVKKRLETVNLETTYDEIFILWKQEGRARPGFLDTGSAVTVPVIFAAVSGVEKGDQAMYWHRLKQLKDAPDTTLIDHLPYIKRSSPYIALAQRALRNGRLDRDIIARDRDYPFALLKPQVQDMIFDAVDVMLEKRVIKGTFTRGAEYQVVSCALNLSAEYKRILQGYEPGRANPKLLVISTGETGASAEDAITICLLSRLGFDVAIFAPTGYRTIEQHLDAGFPVTHEVGRPMYDLSVPDLDNLPPLGARAWLNSLFGRH
ncbi:MAG: YceG family protein [Clostridiales bacterium]|nr:YceG family protein [Clostridiales bacterium]